MIRTHLPQWQILRLVFAELVLLIIPIIFFGIDPRPVHAEGTCSGCKDYGDAPSSYGDASATPTDSLRIGSTTPDSESGSQYSADANGDGADESFLNPLTPIDLANSSYIWTVPVSNTTGSGATLAGWIDFNGNRIFDANERVAVPVPSGTTVGTLTWSIPTTATPNLTTYARLRISTDSNVGATDDYGIGEVEDYLVTTVESNVCAPGTAFYFIRGVEGGEGTIATVNASTGITTFVNNPPTPSSGFVDINGIAVDRFRGIIYYQDAGDVNCDPASGGITCTPATSAPRGIYGYDVVNNSNFTVTPNAQTSLALPLTNGWQTAAGAFANGKYYAGIDGDDSGRVYEITLNSSGTAPVSSRLLISPAVYGTCSPNFPIGSNECRGYGDVLVVGNRMYVALWQGATPETQMLDVYDINSQLRLSRQTIAASGFAFQLGRDGNGQIYAVTSENGRIFRVTNDQIVGYPTSGLVSTIGAIVRDASECPVVPMDFGDAPNSYGTDVGPRAARHGINASLRLGNVTDQTTIRDLHGFSSTAANGDDLNNYNGSSQGGTDDEDSVSNIARLRVDSTTYSITNVVVYNNTGNSATLYGWIDFNRDGVFDQSERATVTVPSSGATQSITITWNNLSGLVSGQSYIRLRLSTSTVTTSTLGTGNDGAFLATGYAPDGEVEDYAVPIDNLPTAVSFSSFSATMPGSGATVWILIGLGGVLVIGTGAFAVCKRRRQ